MRYSGQCASDDCKCDSNASAPGGGQAWRPCTRLGLRPDASSFVVAQVDGCPLQPRSITHEWVRLVERTALPRIRFHDLRHSHASQMLAAGVHPKIASERLGHSTIAITLDLYSHVMPGMQADAAEQVDAKILAARKL